MNLYTDSLKKGTYNYINIDGKMDNGSYLPLDSTTIIFVSTEGKFTGNTLWIPADFQKEKVGIKAILRSNHSICKEFTMYIKKKPDDDNLKSVDEIMDDMKQDKKATRKQKS
ncbi:MAG: hypothetical protein ABIR19_10125 [Ginsengibacter sp.]